MTTVQSILDKASLIIVDETNVNWSASELLGWLNDAYKVIVKAYPQSSVKRVSFSGLTANKPDQSLPSDSIVLLGVHYNTDSGKEVTPVSRVTLNSNVPNWYKATAQDDIKHYVYDSSDPKTVWLYPNPTASTSLEISYSFVPNHASATGDILIDETYSTLILDYVLYRAYLKESFSGGDSSRATASYQAFLQALGQQQP